MKKCIKMPVRSLTFLCAILCILWGCTAVPVSGDSVPETKKNNEESKQTVLVIDAQPVTMEEVRIYLYLLQKPYENCYGDTIWQQEKTDGVSWEEWLLEEAKRQIVEIEILSSRAEQDGMELTDEECSSVDMKADAAFEQMGDAAEHYDIHRETVRHVFEKSELAGRYYEKVTESYEVTLTAQESKECRAMTIQQIFIAEDDAEHLEKGQTQEELVSELRERVMSGEDFETVAKFYSSENVQWTLSFDRNGYVFDTDGWLDEVFTAAAWALEENAVSPVIHTSYGYHIIKCIELDNDVLRQQAAERKLKEKKKAMFAETYNNWMQNVVCTEETEWKNIRIMEGI